MLSRADIDIRHSLNVHQYEHSEANLNSYYGGKRIATNGNDSRRRLDLKNQFESLLTVECTKYTMDDKRRVGDKKIRIILS